VRAVKAAAKPQTWLPVTAIVSKKGTKVHGNIVQAVQPKPVKPTSLSVQIQILKFDEQNQLAVKE
jgi:hypothetical protein